MIQYYMIYQFVKLLAVPFDKWEAYKTGVLNDKGEVLIAKHKRNTAQEKSFGPFETLVRNIKMHLSKIPGGLSKLGSFAAALYLLKEHKMFRDDVLLTEAEYQFDLDKLGRFVEENLASAIISDGWMSKEAQEKKRRNADEDIFKRF